MDVVIIQLVVMVSDNEDIKIACFYIFIVIKKTS